MIDRPLVGGLGVAAVLATLTVYLAFNAGGFFPEATGLVATAMAILIVARAAFSRRPFEGFGVPLAVAVVALGGFAAWVLISASWSDSVARALPEYTRALLYALTLLFFGMARFDLGRLRWMLYGFVAAIVVVCGFAMVARTLPHVIFDPALTEEQRLGYPLTYWNTLGLLAGIGIVLCGHLSCSVRDPWPARVAGAASVPLLTVTLFYTLSRGATWATIAALAVYVLVARPRGLISGAIATAPATLIVLMVANPPEVLAEGYPHVPAAIAAGKHVITVLVACIVGAGLLRASLLPLDRRVADFPLSGRARWSVFIGALMAVVALAASGAVALNLTGEVKAKYDELSAREDGSPGDGGGRLLSASTNGRREHWDVAIASFHEAPLHGSGAGTYGLEWAKVRSGTDHVQDGHSLYIETLGELGLVGLSLLLVSLALILGAFAFRARGPDRALFAALLAAGLCWAIASGVDWDWEMPAVTAWFFAFGGAALARSPRKPEMNGRWTVAIRVAAVFGFLAIAVIPARVSISAARLSGALQAFDVGDCATAKTRARSSLDASGDRAAPYTLIAICDMREGRYFAAVTAMRQAHKRDPNNWELVYDLAVTQAAAGRNPYNTAKRAVKLNPIDEIVRSGPRRFGPARRGEWVQIARRTPLFPPGQGDP